MKKNLFLLLLPILTLLGGCCLHHDWQAADCTRARRCAICGTTAEAPLGHSFRKASCTEPRRCTVCGTAEGVALGHRFSEANCTEPRRCADCGETAGEALGHSFPIANYQEGGYCEHCGEEQPVLPAAFDECGLDANMTAGGTYTYTVPCADNERVLTHGTIRVEEYSVAPEGMEALPGYEWRRVSFSVTFADENAAFYGYRWSICAEDWYNPAARNESAQPLPDGGERFTLNWYGRNYTDCFSLVESDSGSEDGAGVLRVVCAFCVPEGYDGMAVGFCDPRVAESGEQRITALFNSASLFFRLD